MGEQATQAGLASPAQASLATGRVSDGLHGGDVRAASQAYGIAVEHWLDLSTGMNPNPWPVPPLPQTVFEQLPYEVPAFMAAAVDYYGAVGCVAVAGSQMAIEQLPKLLPSYPVLLPTVGYQEHRASWAVNGNDLLFYPSLNTADAASAIDVALSRNTAQHLLVINPNNPTGILFSVERLMGWADTLQDGACLIIDEAFIDLDPQCSVLAASGVQGLPDNVIILRSFGKFFGLAGVRLGFVFSAPTFASRLKARLGLWAVNGPAQQVAQWAFLDRSWQSRQRQRLPASAREQRKLFEPLLSFAKCGTDVQLLAQQPLFSSYLMPNVFALALQDFFATRAILVRIVQVDEINSVLRVGLMADCVQQQSRVRDTLAAFIGTQFEGSVLRHELSG